MGRNSLVARFLLLLHFPPGPPIGPVQLTSCWGNAGFRTSPHHNPALGREQVKIKRQTLLDLSAEMAGGVYRLDEISVTLNSSRVPLRTVVLNQC